MKKYLTLEHAMQLVKMITGAAHLLGGGAPDRIKEKLAELKAIAKKDYPADANIKWEAIEQACDEIIARGVQIDVLIDAEPSRG